MKMKKVIKKPFKIAAWSYVLFLILSTIFGFLIRGQGIVPYDYNSPPVLIFLSVLCILISFVLLLLIFYGFILLGKKFNNNLLSRVSVLGIFIFTIYTIYILFGGLLLNVPVLPTADNYESWSQDQINGPQQLGTFILIGYIVMSIVLGVVWILFGISLLRLRKKIKYAKSAGILNIITGATLFIFIGYLIAIPALIMEIMLLFEASRRFEKNKK